MELRQRIAIRDFLQIPLKRGEDWPRTRPAIELLCERKGYILDKKLYMKQAARLRDDALDNRPRTRRFIELFTKLTGGTDYRSAGLQDTVEQRRFRLETINAYNAKQPHPLAEDLWCPVLCKYFSRGAMRVARIFSHLHGQKLMNELFGMYEGQENEMFAPYNGLLMIAEAEERFRKGLFVIVPSVKDVSPKEIKKWQTSEPKNYKIRVVDHKAYLMTRSPAGWLEKRWNDLDGRELEFRSDHRPSPQYLYFHYCVTMLRRSWYHADHETVLQDRLGKNFWDVPGRFLRRQQLLALAEEIGNDGLLEGAGNEADHKDVDQDEESGQIALAAANDAVRFSIGKGPEAFTDALDDDDEDGDKASWGKELEIGICPRCNCSRCSAVFGRAEPIDVHDEKYNEDDDGRDEFGGEAN